MLLSPASAMIIVAILRTPAPPQSTFHPPTECGPVVTVPVHGVPEAQGRSTDITVWALFFQRPVEARTDVKVVWRVTGTGGFNVRAYHPSGATAEADRVQEHLGSTWQKPGDEWGSWFNFPVSGCWNLHVTHGQSSGDLWINVK